VIGVLVALAAWVAGPAPAKAVQRDARPEVVALQRGYAAYRAGAYHDAAHLLAGAVGKGLHSEDWAVYLLAESQFYDGEYGEARARFERLARGHGGRPAELAPFRVADCLWMEGDRAHAVAAYAKLQKKASPRAGDVALARFRIAQAAATRDAEGARKQFLAIARDFPAHPLADEALRRIGGAAAAAAAAATTAGAPPRQP